MMKRTMHIHTNHVSCVDGCKITKNTTLSGINKNFYEAYMYLQVNVKNIEENVKDG